MQESEKIGIKNELESNNARERILEKMNQVTQKEFSIIEDYILEGYKKTLANLLFYLGEERAESIKKKLPESIRREVEPLIPDSNEKKKEDPDIITEAGRVLKVSGYYGKVTANEVLEALDLESKAEARKLCPEYMKVNPILALNVNRYSFMFEDLLSLNARSIQKMLREVDQVDLAMALKGSTLKVQEKIFRNMSRRAADMVREDMEFMEPVRKYDILEAQDKILRILTALEDSGEIVIERDNGFGSFLN